MSRNLTNSRWNGYERHDFRFEGRKAVVVTPQKPAPGNPWLWEADGFGDFCAVETAMLEKGWHIASYDVGGMFGCPQAVHSMRIFHAFLEGLYGLNPQTVLLGCGAGALCAFNYAYSYPKKAAALCLDSPVLDIRSWPGGKGSGTVSTADWQLCMAVYGLTDETAWGFKGDPLDRAEKVAWSGMPVVVICRDNDRLVPFSENGGLLVEKYAKSKGCIRVIAQAGSGHGDHSLEDPMAVVDFLMRSARFSKTDDS